MEIQDVDSFDYFIAPGFNGAPRAGQAFQAAAPEAYDMLIADYYAGHNTIDPAGVRIFQDSNSRGRLAIAYIDAGEFMRCCSNIDLPDQARWFDAQGELTAAAPRWFGPRNPNFNGLWVVRDWDPAWQTYVLGEIDKMIALGFDGVFLDTLYSDDAWGPNGFAAGLAGVADYRERQKDFAKTIWHHVRDRHHNSRFVIITNYSGVLDNNVPALTEGLHYSDAFMKESEYFLKNKPAPWVGNTPIEQWFATRYTIMRRSCLKSAPDTAFFCPTRTLRKTSSTSTACRSARGRPAGRPTRRGSTYGSGALTIPTGGGDEDARPRLRGLLEAFGALSQFLKSPWRKARR